MLYRDSLLTGNRRSRVQIRPKNPKSLGKNRSKRGQQNKPQVATVVDKISVVHKTDCQPYVLDASGMNMEFETETHVAGSEHTLLPPEAMLTGPLKILKQIVLKKIQEKIIQITYYIEESAKLKHVKQKLDS